MAALGGWGATPPPHYGERVAVTADGLEGLNASCLAKTKEVLREKTEVHPLLPCCDLCCAVDS